MTLVTLQHDMILALKQGHKEEKDVIANLVDVVKKAAIDSGCRDNVTEQLVDSVLLKQQKIVQEQINTCPPTRTDLLEKYTKELEIINSYAPKIITDKNVIVAMIEAMLNDAAIEPSKKNKGIIMKQIMPQLKGKADMKIASECINTMLN